MSLMEIVKDVMKRKEISPYKGDDYKIIIHWFDIKNIYNIM